MEQKRNQFPHDQDNRIQKLYYDVNINTIFNRTKLQNVKNKFWKYLIYLQKYEQNIQPKLLELQKIRDGLYTQLKRAKAIAFQHNPKHVSHKKRDFLIWIFDEADDNYEEMKYEEHFYDTVIGNICDKIKQIKNQQNNIKKCVHCKKMAMVTISGCKSKHKLCYECIYDKTECPVCNEDLGLVHCDICMEYKKELVDTGCKNKHQTCNECLLQIQKPGNIKYKCPFCRETIYSDEEDDGFQQWRQDLDDEWYDEMLAYDERLAAMDRLREARFAAEDRFEFENGEWERGSGGAVRIR